jgi:hypothetical protein
MQSNRRDSVSFWIVTLLKHQDRSLPIITKLTPDVLYLYICVAFAPWIKTSLVTTEHEFYLTRRLYTPRQDLLYSRETFLEYIKDCRMVCTIFI